jgi:hypothetical protein
MRGEYIANPCWATASSIVVRVVRSRDTIGQIDFTRSREMTRGKRIAKDDGHGKEIPQKEKKKIQDGGA